MKLNEFLDLIKGYTIHSKPPSTIRKLKNKLLMMAMHLSTFHYLKLQQTRIKLFRKRHRDKFPGEIRIQDSQIQKMAHTMLIKLMYY